MTHILELQSGIAWRQKWRIASFRQAPFHVETGVRESGRRIVPHEFPKRDIPYAEDMGKRAREFTVRGYIIVYPESEAGRRNRIVDPRRSRALQSMNYLPARDALITALEAEGPAILQLPLLGAMNVAVTRYRVTEESRYGGFCVFDMTFIEYGKAPAEGSRDTSVAVKQSAQEQQAVTGQRLREQLKKLQETPRPMIP